MAYPCVLKRVLPKIQSSVFVFFRAFCFANLSVCTSARVYIYTSAAERWCSFPCVFCDFVSGAGQDTSVSLCMLHHLVPLQHMLVCEPFVTPNTNGVIRNKCSKVQLLDPATPKERFPQSFTAPPGFQFPTKTRWGLSATQKRPNTHLPK